MGLEVPVVGGVLSVAYVCVYLVLTWRPLIVSASVAPSRAAALVGVVKWAAGMSLWALPLILGGALGPPWDSQETLRQAVLYFLTGFAAWVFVGASATGWGRPRQRDVELASRTSPAGRRRSRD